IALTGLSLRARNADSDWVRIPSLLVSGTSFALPAQTVDVQKVALEGLAADAWMSADGSINLEQLLAFETASEPQDAGPPQAPSPAAEPAQPWTVTVGAMELTNASVAFEDRSLAPATRFDFAPVNLRASGISLDLSRPLPVQLDAVIN